MASSMAVRTSEATLWGWRINSKGTDKAPVWVALAGAPQGYELGGRVPIRWRVACDLVEVPLPDAKEMPHNGELLDRISWDASYEGEALLEIGGTFFRFGRAKKSGTAYLIPLEFPPEYAHLVGKIQELVAAERRSAELILQLGSALAHKHGGW